MTPCCERSGWWITLDWIGDRLELDHRPLAFRGGIELPAEAETGWLRIYAFEHYTLWVNDRIVATGPARSTSRYPAYDRIDLSGILRRGDNALAVLVTQPTGEVSHRGRVALWCDWECRLRDGSVVTGATDGDWQVRRADWYREVRLPTAISGTWQEHVDARREPAGWRTAAYSELDSGWNAVFVLGPVDWTPPWRFPEPRDVPPLRRTQLTPPVIWRGRSDATAAMPENNLADRLSSLTWSGRELQEAFPVAGLTLAAGDAVTFDLGRNRAILPEFEVVATHDGLILECYGDIAWHGVPSASGSAVTGRGGISDSFHAGTGPSRFATLNPRGCRFWTLRAAGHGHGHVRIRLWSEEYPYDDTAAEFASSNADWNAYWAIGRETLRASTMDAFVDTVWREQSLWTRDAAVAGRAAFYSFGETAMWRRSLRLVAESITTDGVPVAVAPGAVSHLSLPDQTMAWVEGVGDYIVCSGDVGFLDEVFPAIERFLALCSEHLHEPGCFVPPAWSWHFVDWGEVDRRPYSLAQQALLAAAVRSAIAMAQLRPAAVPDRLIDLQTRVYRGLEAFYDPETGWYRGHLDPESPGRFRTLYLGPACDHSGCAPRHGNALLLAAKLAPPGRVAALGRQLARHLENAPDHAFGPSWFDVMIKGLLRGGQPEAALRLLHSRCQPAVDCGAPTYGEDFPFSRWNSAHGWSASVNTALIEGFWGLEILEPGMRRLRVAPCPGLPEGSYRLHTPAGWLHLQWRQGELSVDAAPGVMVDLTSAPLPVTV